MHSLVYLPWPPALYQENPTDANQVAVNTQLAIKRFLKNEFIPTEKRLHKSLCALCEEVGASLEVTADVPSRRHLGVLQVSRMKKRFARLQKNSNLSLEERKRYDNLLEICNGPVSLYSLILDPIEDSVIQEEGFPGSPDQHHRIGQMEKHVQRKAEFVEFHNQLSSVVKLPKRLQDMTPASFRWTLSDPVQSEDNVHQLLFGPKIAAQANPEKMQKLIQALPALKERNGTWSVLGNCNPAFGVDKYFQRKYSPDRFAWTTERIQQIYLDKAGQIQPYQSPPRGDRGACIDLKWESEDLDEFLLGLLKLPLKYIPDCIGEWNEFMILADFHQRHFQNQTHRDLKLDIASIWQEYQQNLRSTKKPQTLKTLLGDIQEVAQVFSNILRAQGYILGGSRDAEVTCKKEKIRKWVARKAAELDIQGLESLRILASTHQPAMTRIWNTQSLIPQKHARAFAIRLQSEKTTSSRLIQEFDSQTDRTQADFSWPEVLPEPMDCTMPDMRIRELSTSKDLVRNGELLRHCVGTYTRVCLQNQRPSHILEMFVQDGKPHATAEIHETHGKFQMGECKLAENQEPPKKVLEEFTQAIALIQQNVLDGRVNLEENATERAKKLRLYLQSKENLRTTREQDIYHGCLVWNLAGRIFQDLPEIPVGRNILEEVNA